MAEVATVAAAPAHAAGMQDLYDMMRAQSMAPLWDIYSNLVTRQPVRSEPSRIWKWAEYLPAVLRSAEAVRGELADHRVLLLKNPDAPGKMATTTNLIAGIQCVMPGERTEVHRHSASACRLILDGTGGSTFVDGKRCRMNTNDFIITPSMTWHGHENDSATRAIWLDMLDVPMLGYLDANFGAQGPAPSYPADISTLPDNAFAGGGLVPADQAPAAMAYSPRFRWAWAEVVKALEAMPAGADGTKRLRYSNPLDGGAVMATLDASVTEVADTESAPTRTTANGFCVVLEGEGESQVGEKRHAWRQRDIFTLPHWSWVTHRASAPRARLLVVSDREVLRRLGLLREEIRR